jgi:hypothetical protein
VDRIMRLLLDRESVVCVGCLARATKLPRDEVRQVATDLVAAGVLTEGSGPCPVCGSRSDVLQAAA